LSMYNYAELGSFKKNLHSSIKEQLPNSKVTWDSK